MYVSRSIEKQRLMTRILRKVALFSCFTIIEIRKIVRLLCEEKFLAGEYIIKNKNKNDIKNENFYIIRSGECELIPHSSDGMTTGMV
jgi:hypothetical protein